MRLLVAEVAAAASPLSSASTECNSPTCRWKPYSNSTDFQANASVLLILLFSALVCALSLCAAIRCFLRPTTPSETDANDHKPDPEADGSSIIPTPTLVYSSDLELAGAEAECAICLSEFEEGESIQVLEKCHHGFHVKCIHKWLSSHSSCPTCRTSIFLQSTLESAPSTEAPSTNQINA
ncbi:RING-H2 finger protein ATL79 [Raphanus sativus]|uniref:RING-type E3 ubiquitin transferase n=1 Tax=Raphanus sativus TaxID=3726 RepID=A0A6J0JV07_RAPSA|nr:RING-H2 finger protein ATL79 [Raphanus sativus]KAJ4888553.1 RING-H2 finger protein ATL79 [Raphanus sativus]